MLVKQCSKFSKLGFNNMWTVKFQMFKLALEKAEEPEIKLATSAGSSKKQESSRKTSISALLLCQSFWLCRSHKLWKILQEMWKPDHLTHPLRNLYAGQEAPVRIGPGTTCWFQIRKEGKYIKAVYCHPAYLTSMQSTSWETPGWMKHKLESRLPGEISITSDMQMTPPLRQKARTKEHLGSNSHDRPLVESLRVIENTGAMRTGCGNRKFQPVKLSYY